MTVIGWSPGRTRRRPGPRAGLGAITVLALAVTACANPDAREASTTGPSSGTTTAKTSLVLSDGYDTATWNPLNGDSDYTSKVHDGVLRLVAEDGPEPTIAPNLATGMPTANADATEWTVTLRDGVRFHDGQELTAKDVAATYNTAIDPAAAAGVASMYDMLERAEATDGHTVVFHLTEPYAGDRKSVV